MTPPQRRQPKAWMIGLAVLLFVSLVALQQRPSSATRDGSKKAPSFSADSPAGAAISSSSVAGMDAYQCNEGGTPSVLLLHGSRFTKEDWKKSGILQQFCERGYTVWALDFPVASSYSVLERVLSELRPAKPALVTPSAGGNAVVDWINNNQGAPLGDQILCWIPVASNAALTIQASNVSRRPVVPTLAIYGDQDAGGKKSMTWLASLAPTTQLLELPGRHPCYLDSPDAFVEAIDDFIKGLQ